MANPGNLSSLPDFQQILRAVVMATKSSNQLPKLGDKYEVLSSHALFAQLMTVEGQRIRDLVGKLLKASGVKASFGIASTDDLLEQLVDCNDTLLEKIGNHLDEAMGVRKPAEPILIQSSIDGDRMASVTAWNRSSGSAGAAGTSGSTGSAWDRTMDRDVLPFSPTLRGMSQSNTLGSRSPSAYGRSDSRASSVTSASAASGRISLLCSKNQSRPQLLFADLIDNSNRPFVPRLAVKYHSIAGSSVGGKNMVIVDDDHVTNNDEEMVYSSSFDMADPKSNVAHPYSAELGQLTFDKFIPDGFSSSGSDTLSASSDSIPIPPLALDDTPLTLVASRGELELLRDHLNGQKLFAVDLEHHNYRSFLGLTCLIQITTVDPTSGGYQDFIVDTLALWRHVGILNEPFANPDILKVLHGAESDVEWLQRDFGVYIVGMFDTGQAMRVLSYPKFSLAYLLKRTLDVTVNKEFQLADWRIRPLPPSMVDYARADTHFLLYCYGRLRRQLVDNGNEQNNLIRTVFERSRDICLRQYQKPLYTDSDYLDLVKRRRGQRGQLTPRQLLALKHIYAWRDTTARREDESVHYVLPNVALLSIAEKLPREAQGILACCNPVPPLVKQDLHALHQIIYNARSCELENQGMLDAPVLGKVTMYGGGDLGQDIGFPRRQLNPLLHSCHDFSHTDETEEIGLSSQQQQGGEESMDTTISPEHPPFPAVVVESKSLPILNIFADEIKSGDPSVKKLKNEQELKASSADPGQVWMSPYEKYKLSLERRKETLAELATIKKESEATSDTAAAAGNRPRGHGIQNWSREAQDEESDMVIVKERVVVKVEQPDPDAMETAGRTAGVEGARRMKVQNGDVLVDTTTNNQSSSDSSVMPAPAVIPKQRNSSPKPIPPPSNPPDPSNNFSRQFQSPDAPSEEFDSVRNRIRREQALKRMFDGPPAGSGSSGSRNSVGRQSGSATDQPDSQPGPSSSSSTGSERHPEGSGRKKPRKVVKLDPFDYEEAKRNLSQEIKLKQHQGNKNNSGEGGKKTNKKKQKRLGGGDGKKKESMKHLRNTPKERSISYKGPE